MKKLFTITFCIFISILLFYFYYAFFSSFKKSSYRIDKKDYLISVTACEMPASYELEAIKAQVVAARTYYYYKVDLLGENITNDDQCTITIDEMKSKWGDAFDYYYNRIKSAVEETQNEVVMLDNKLFKTYYFSTSNGYTEDSINVFKENTIKGVDSSFDKYSKEYLKTVIKTKDELMHILGNFNNIEVIKRDEHNHVLIVKVDNKVYTGIEFRKLLNLRSTDFEIIKSNNNYEITTHGYGHDVGMSQYGANYLAKNNNTYKDILKYYYGDIKLVKY